MLLDGISDGGAPAGAAADGAEGCTEETPCRFPLLPVNLGDVTGDGGTVVTVDAVDGADGTRLWTREMAIQIQP